MRRTSVLMLMRRPSRCQRLDKPLKVLPLALLLAFGEPANLLLGPSADDGRLERRRFLLQLYDPQVFVHADLVADHPRPRPIWPLGRILIFIGLHHLGEGILERRHPLEATTPAAEIGRLAALAHQHAEPVALRAQPPAPL